MKYYIQRQLNEYGPYTLADLQRYVAQGSILLTDMARSEGMTEWAPLSQIMGNIPIQTPPVTPAASATPVATGTPVATATPVYAVGTVYSGAAVSPQASNAYPIPPDLHWALVLLIGWFCSLFPLIWLFVEAGFVRKLDRTSNFMTFLIAGMCTWVVSIFGFFVGVGLAANQMESGQAGPPPFLFLFVLVLLAGVAMHIVGIFQMRSVLENHYNSVEPINLRLSGVMTFFFAVYYFQYHFTRIANWKKNGYLQPQ
jgi:uncharacterized membrane protein HdeD (DUF308 family)